MKCQKCNTENPIESKFCKKCGTSLQIANIAEIKTSDTLLMIFVISLFVTTIIKVTIEKTNPEWYIGPTRYVQSGIWIIQNLTFVLVPLAIKDKTLKIIGTIITAILVIYWIYLNINYMFSY